MRRALASLLLVLIGLPLSTPLLLAGPRPELPACCRRGGKHHCEMAAMDNPPAPAAPTIGSLQAKCRFYPKPGALPAYPRAGIFVVWGRIVPADPLHAQVDRLNCRHPRLATRDTERKRGPPAFS
jgi:hypothetical protein